MWNGSGSFDGMKKRNPIARVVTRLKPQRVPMKKRKKLDVEALHEMAAVKLEQNRRKK
jgi:hypothetical protein